MNKIEFTRFAELDYTGDEALNTLCTNLTFAGDGVRKIMMTSCHASEGKSFITMNMMRTFARLGKRVVLVDADLRRSMLLTRYGGRVPKGVQFGLAHYLAGMCSAEDVLYETSVPGAYMVPVGREVNNSLSLLTTRKLSQLLDWLGDKFDFVLVDAPRLPQRKRDDARLYGYSSPFALWRRRRRAEPANVAENGAEGLPRRHTNDHRHPARHARRRADRRREVS